MYWQSNPSSVFRGLVWVLHVKSLSGLSQVSLACTLAIFCQDGQEILGLKDVQSIYDRSLQEGGQKKAQRNSWENASMHAHQRRAS